MITNISFVVQTVPEKHTHGGPKFKFVMVIRTKMRIAGTPKNFKKSVRMMFLEQPKIRRLIGNNRTWKPIN